MVNKFGLDISKMKILRFKIYIIFISLFFIECNNNSSVSSEFKPDDIKSFLKYYNKNVNFDLDLTYQDEKSNLISKINFLKALTTGKYYPKMVNNEPNIIQLKIFEKNTDIDIIETMKYYANNSIFNFELEGVGFPSFDLYDINGKRFKRGNSLGKISLIKFWYIGCKACVMEFPDLNRIEEIYRPKLDFYSISFDSRSELKDFFKKRELNFINLSDTEDVIGKKIGIKGYPTLVLVNTDFKIIKVFNGTTSLEIFLNNTY